MTAGGGADAGVRRAGAADLPVLARTLTRAFHDDPVARYACPRDDLRPWMLERFHDARDRQMLRAGEIWMTPGGESAAAWAAPDQWRSSPDPAAQGRGLGTAVLAPVLEECDRDGVGAYLESSKESNVAYYARFGFRITEELRLPRGPRLWLMWRDAR
jgi:ribosomal protein S18 acetylase RimI-like enzyme